MDRRGRWTTFAGNNEASKLEFPRAWEPLDSSQPSQDGDGTIPMVCLLIDTRMHKEDFKKLCKDIEMPHRYIVKKSGLGGGLALLWKEGVDVCVINHTDNLILAKIVKDDGSTWFLTSFYGWPKAS